MSTLERPVTQGFVVHDEEFLAVVGETPVLTLVARTDAHEGPVYSPDEDALYFTTLPRPRDSSVPGRPLVEIKRLALDGDRFPLGPERIAVVRPDANVANGMTRDGQGRLIVCEQGTGSDPAAIARIDPVSGARETLVDSFAGLPLNSPNDVVASGDGTLWFTDPTYGWLQGFRPRPQLGNYLYRYEPQSNRLAVVAGYFDKPNGLAFSPDERTLYVGDSGGPHHIKAFDVVGGRQLANERIFCTIRPGHPDGIQVDAAGRVYSSCASGIQVFTAEGALLGEILLAGAVNLIFGGARRDLLFITTDDAIWAARLGAKGA